MEKHHSLNLPLRLSEREISPLQGCVEFEVSICGRKELNWPELTANGSPALTRGEAESRAGLPRAHPRLRCRCLASRWYCAPEDRRLLPEKSVQALGKGVCCSSRLTPAPCSARGTLSPRGEEGLLSGTPSLRSGAERTPDSSPGALASHRAGEGGMQWDCPSGVVLPD